MRTLSTFPLQSPVQMGGFGMAIRSQAPQNNKQFLREYFVQEGDRRVAYVGVHGQEQFSLFLEIGYQQGSRAQVQIAIDGMDIYTRRSPTLGLDQPGRVISNGKTNNADILGWPERGGGTQRRAFTFADEDYGVAPIMLPSGYRVGTIEVAFWLDNAPSATVLEPEPFSNSMFKGNLRGESQPAVGAGHMVYETPSTEYSRPVVNGTLMAFLQIRYMWYDEMCAMLRALGVPPICEVSEDLPWPTPGNVPVGVTQRTDLSRIPMPGQRIEDYPRLRS